MAPSIFPAPKFDSDPTPHTAPPADFAARVRTRLRRDELDDQLARGVDPDATADPDARADLRLRAMQLGSGSDRSRLANALVEALGDARGSNLGAFRTKTRRNHDAIQEAADELLALVLRLRDERPVDVRGAAMTARLLSDRRSALHRDSAQELQAALRATRAALDATDPATRRLATAA